MVETILALIWLIIIIIHICVLIYHMMAIVFIGLKRLWLYYGDDIREWYHNDFLPLFSSNKSQSNTP